jgi:hypothetical protein
VGCELMAEAYLVDRRLPTTVRRRLRFGLNQR